VDLEAESLVALVIADADIGNAEHDTLRLPLLVLLLTVLKLLRGAVGLALD